jgi:hypothetical protein
MTILPPQPRSRTTAALILVLSVIAAMTAFLAFRSDPPARLGADHGRTDGPASTLPLDSPSAASPAAAGRESLAAAAKKPAVHPDLETDPVILATRAGFRKLANEIESKNTRKVSQRRYEKMDVVVVAIAAPSVEDIRTLATHLTKLIEGVEPPRRAEVRQNLQYLYDNYVSHPASHCLVIASRFHATGKTVLHTVEVDEVADPLQAPDGIIRMDGKSSTHSTVDEDDPVTGWKVRYGHLQKLLEFQE